MQTRSLHRDNRDVDAFWVGNNAAFKCPACNGVYLVSAHMNPNGLACPRCGNSIGNVQGGRDSGGTATISWPVKDNEPAARPTKSAKALAPAFFATLLIMLLSQWAWNYQAGRGMADGPGSNLVELANLISSVAVVALLIMMIVRAIRNRSGSAR